MAPVAKEASRRIQALYQVGTGITGLPAPWRLAQRRRASGKALRYALTRWEALARHAEDGRLAINNKLAERLLRGIAVSRKNFLLAGSAARWSRPPS